MLSSVSRRLANALNGPTIRRPLLRASNPAFVSPIKSLNQPSQRWLSVAHRDEKTAVLIETEDESGALQEALKFFWKHNVNMTHIESRPGRGDTYAFYIDFEGNTRDERIKALLKDLKANCQNLMVMGERQVPWFPRRKADLDTVAGQTMDAGGELSSDHPGFKDQEYRKRREELAAISNTFEIGKPIPRVTYTEREIATWRTVWEKLMPLMDQYACKEYKYILPLMKSECGYAPDNIPQAEDISRFLNECTGFTLRPVGGLLSSRDFLNGLAFRVFFSTQYIRHHSVPLYTPEPDICHELLGHAPMFADPDFADFSHEIGLASLGASDEDIQKLATCYWFSVEFGLCRQDGALKAYGAGLLSSFGELEYACSPTRPAGDRDDFPEYLEWDPYKACDIEYPITTYQPKYFVAESLADAKDRMREFCEKLKKPFHARYNPYTQTVWVDRAVKVVDTEEQKKKKEKLAKKAASQKSTASSSAVA